MNVCFGCLFLLGKGELVRERFFQKVIFFEGATIWLRVISVMPHLRQIMFDQNPLSAPPDEWKEWKKLTEPVIDRIEAEVELSDI